MTLQTIKYDRNQFVEFQHKRSPNNSAGALKAFKWFDKFLGAQNETEESIMPKLREVKGSDEFYLFLNSFVQFMFKDLHPHSVQTYFSFIKSYLRKSGFKIYNEDVKHFIDIPRVINESREPLTKDTISILLEHASPYLQMVILCLVSSGMRSSEFLQLQPEDIKFNAEPVEVHIRAETTKTKSDRVTFLSKQAVKNIDKEMLFKPYNPKLSLLNLEHSFGKLRDECNLLGKYRTSNVHHVTLHTFRSFFRTQVGLINRDFAEDFLGHQGYLKQYIRFSLEQKRQFYLEVEPELTV